MLFFFVMAAKNGECVCRLLFLWQQFLLLPQRSFFLFSSFVSTFWCGFMIFYCTFFWSLKMFEGMENLKNGLFMNFVICCFCMDNKFSTSLAGCVYNKRNTEKSKFVLFIDFSFFLFLIIFLFYLFSLSFSVLFLLLGIMGFISNPHTLQCALMLCFICCLRPSHGITAQ